jgi:nucleoside-diphosphate-sugar epimerase
MKRAVVCGAGGFIGGHLVRRLKNEGYWVRGVDVKESEFSPTVADEFVLLDLRDRDACEQAVRTPEVADEVYQLAADMGGMGFIHSAECEIMRNNALININMADAAVAVGVPSYFYSSSVCIYRDMAIGEPELTEEDAYPAQPDNEYGWEKLYSERVLQAYARRSGMRARIARFQNCYGPQGTWRGGREKAPAAICRKVAEAQDGGSIEVWGDGKAVRSFVYVEDLVDAVFKLMHSEIEQPVNIGSREYVSVDDLVALVADVAGKRIESRYVDGPVGVESRNFANDRVESLGWTARHSLRDGLAATYPWIEEQVRSAAAAVH